MAQSQGIFDDLVAAAKRIDFGSNAPGQSPSITVGFGEPVANEATGSIYYRQDAPNAAFVLYVRAAGVWMPVVAGAGTSSATEFVFRPGEPNPGGNVFASWASLVTAAQLQVGPKVVYIDTTLGAATIPAGNWDFGSPTTFAGNPGKTTTATATALTIADGAFLANVFVFQDLAVVGQSTTFTIDAPVGAVGYTLRGLTSITQTGAGAFIRKNDAGTIAVHLFLSGRTISGTFINRTVAGTVGVNAFDIGAIAANTIVGVAGSAGVGLVDSPAASISNTQAGMPGGVFGTIINNSLAANVAYTDAAPLLGATQVQAAIDALKAYVVGEPLRFAQQAAVTANATRYLPYGTGLEATQPGKTVIPIPRLSIYSTIQIDVGASPSAGHSTVYTVQKDGVDTGLTVTISGVESTKSATLAGGVTFNPGQYISIKQVTDAGNIQTDSRVTVY